MLRAACGHHHTAVLICFMHKTNFQICKIHFISIEHKCPVISVFEYFLRLFVLLFYVLVNSFGNGGGRSVHQHNTFFLGKLEQAVNQ